MNKRKQRRFKLSPQALKAFQQMMFHQLSLWDAAYDLEQAIGCEVDSGKLDGLAACFGTPQTSGNLTQRDLTYWLQSAAGEDT